MSRRHVAAPGLRQIEPAGRDLRFEDARLVATHRGFDLPGIGIRTVGDDVDQLRALEVQAHAVVSGPPSRKLSRGDQVLVKRPALLLGVVVRAVAVGQ